MSSQALSTPLKETTLPLLDQVIAATRQNGRRETELPRDCLGQFLKLVLKGRPHPTRRVELVIKFWIKEIDRKLTDQLNALLHHPDFQRLESAWRGLYFLVRQTEEAENVKIRILNVNKRELLRDLEKAVEFDQSALFKKVYEEEYGQLGGEPYGLLLGDYEFGRSPEDLLLLEKIGNIAAAAHAPFVAGASPRLFNLERFSELAIPRDLSKVFQSVELTGWRSLRDQEDARYVALTLPRVLARLPYGEKGQLVEAFDFQEDVDGPNYDKYLWMNAAWAYATRVADAFARYGWLARTRGLEGGGKVENLPVQAFPTDEGDVAKKCSTEVALSDRREFELSNLGFLPLLHCKDRDYAVFMGSQSCQKPKVYNSSEATANAELSAKFNFLLCVSRFAHYLKVLARDRIGTTMEAGECERWLNDWLNQFVTDPMLAGEDLKARKPLAEGRVQVTPVPGKPGWYQTVVHLRPHYQLETLTTTMRLVAEVPKKK